MMDGPRLYSALIENCRSINRKIEIRLDAPVVLIQGPNGAGKSTLLSAIELALTGNIPSLARADPGYQAQLLHHGATEGRIILEVRDIENVPNSIEIKLRPNGLTTTGKLSERSASFFSERCVLAQSLLTQLLTIYQESDATIDSPLSRFVHELLGLDRLDALDLGLYPGRDIRNARKLVPSYEEVERERDSLNDRVNGTRAQLAEVNSLITRTQSVLQNALTVMEIAMPVSDAQRRALESVLTSEAEDSALVELAEKLRILIILRRELGRVVEGALSRERAELEAAYRRSQNELAAWRRQYSSKVEEVVANVRRLFPNSEPLRQEDPTHAISAAIASVSAELERVDAIVSSETSNTKRRAEVEDVLAGARSRVERLDREIGSVAADAGGLSAALSELLPHIHTDDCPVCGRDYRELGGGSLSARVAARAAELSDQAERLTALTRERASLEAQRVTLEREKEFIVARTLTPKANLDLQDRRAKLRELISSLRILDSPAKRGSELVAVELDARRRLASLSTHGGQEQLRLSAAELAISLGLAAPESTESLEAALDRIEKHILSEQARLKARLDARSTAQRELRNLNVQHGQVMHLHQEIARYEQTQKRVDGALRGAERIRADVRRIVSTVSETRTAIISRVFNDRLNRLWRDLFVRLAPSEDFVPEFHIPTTSQERLVPTLETRHRSGGTGGTPGAMLSAANLNTAALTLFFGASSVGKTIIAVAHIG
jgi:exonuclease SbcC